MFKYDILSMRLVEKRDLEFLLELRSEPSVWKQLGNIRMISTQSQVEWFDKLQRDPTKEYYILEANDNKIGMIRTDEIDFLNRSMRVGGDIHFNYWDRHFGTRMMELIKQYCFGYLNMHRIWLMVLDSNEKAKHLYEKAGFIKEGVHREAILRKNKYIDYIVMGMLRSEFENLTNNNENDIIRQNS